MHRLNRRRCIHINAKESKMTRRFTPLVTLFLAAGLTALILIGCSNTLSNSGSQDSSLASAGSKYLAQGKYTGAYFPTDGWRECRPEAVGMNSEKLAQAIEYAATPAFKTDGVAVIRKGHIVAEAYLGGFKQNSVHVSHSMAKSFTSTLIGIAIDKGLIESVDEKLCRFYPEWDCEDTKDLRSKITIRHAMTLTTGLEWYEDWSRWDPSTNDALKMGASGRFVTYMAERKGLYEPGQRFVYSTGDPMLLTKVIQEAAGMSAFDFADDNLFGPLNIIKVRWDRDMDGYTATAWGLYTTVRDFAKLGYLFLNKGNWDGRQVVSEAWVEQSTRTDRSVRMWEAYGYLWHVNLPYRLSQQFHKSPVSRDALPADSYMAEGVLGQTIVIIPSKDLVAVRVANETGGGHMDLVKYLTMVIEAVEE
jgi:CubicO group peptidase (beta-lactamase class C family)